MKNLNEIKKQLESIASNWNGDESGLNEERAMAAGEGIDYLKGLESILKELGI